MAMFLEAICPRPLPPRPGGVGVGGSGLAPGHLAGVGLSLGLSCPLTAAPDREASGFSSQEKLVHAVLFYS